MKIYVLRIPGILKPVFRKWAKSRETKRAKKPRNK